MKKCKRKLTVIAKCDIEMDDYADEVLSFIADDALKSLLENPVRTSTGFESGHVERKTAEFDNKKKASIAVSIHYRNEYTGVEDDGSLYCAIDDEPARKWIMVNCAHCGKNVDAADNPVFVGFGTNWAHRECYDKAMLTGGNEKLNARDRK